MIVDTATRSARTRANVTNGLTELNGKSCTTTKTKRTFWGRIHSRHRQLDSLRSNAGKDSCFAVLTSTVDVWQCLR